ncbi:MAG: hypothetical protein ACQEXJ_02445 [Myxococcota bacterium]
MAGDRRALHDAVHHRIDALPEREDDRPPFFVGPVWDARHVGRAARRAVARLRRTP